MSYTYYIFFFWMTELVAGVHYGMWHLLWVSWHSHVLHAVLLHWTIRGGPGGSEGAVGDLWCYQVRGSIRCTSYSREGIKRPCKNHHAKDMPDYFLPLMLIELVITDLDLIHETKIMVSLFFDVHRVIKERGKTRCGNSYKHSYLLTSPNRTLFTPQYLLRLNSHIRSKESPYGIQ